MEIDSTTEIISLLKEARTRFEHRIRVYEKRKGINTRFHKWIDRIRFAIDALDSVAPYSISSKRCGNLLDVAKRLNSLSEGTDGGMSLAATQEVISITEDLVDLVLPIVGISDFFGFDGIRQEVTFLQGEWSKKFTASADAIDQLKKTEEARQEAFKHLQARQDQISARMMQQLQAAHAQISEAITSLEARSDAAISSVKKAIADQSELSQMTEDERISRLDQALKAFQTEVSAIRQEHQKLAHETGRELSQLKIQLAEEVRRSAKSEIDEVMARIDGAKSVLSQALSEIEQPAAEAKSRAEGTLNALLEMKQKAGVISNYIASQGLAGDYNRKARHAMYFGIFWQFAALVSGLTFVYFSYDTYSGGVQGITWPELAARGLVALSLLAVGGLSLRQAERDYARHARNERLGLELACLDPYLSSLTSADQTEVKKRLAERFFGSANELQSRAEAIPASVLELAKVLIEAATASKSEKKE